MENDRVGAAPSALGSGGNERQSSGLSREVYEKVAERGRPFSHMAGYRGCPEISAGGREKESSGSRREVLS